MGRKSLKLMPDYDCSPIWLLNEEFFEPIELDSLEFDLPVSLKSRINKWDELFQNTLNREVPQESGFTSESEKDSFVKEGIEIWEELSNQLPEFEISYFNVKDYKLYKQNN